MPLSTNSGNHDVRDDDVHEQLTRSISLWQDIVPPNPLSTQMLDEVEGLVRAFHDIRNDTSFDDAPCGFDQALEGIAALERAR